jgi:molybdopterin synthase sulfur carrier subunit
MTVEVRIPTILRPYTSGEKLVTVEGTSLAEVINNLEITYPGLGDRLTDENGLRRFINIYINDEDVRFLSGLQSVISANDSITILPAVAGGM